MKELEKIKNALHWSGICLDHKATMPWDHRIIIDGYRREIMSGVFNGSDINDDGSPSETYLTKKKEKIEAFKNFAARRGYSRDVVSFLFRFSEDK